MELIHKRELMVSMRECDMYGRMRPSVMLGLFQDGSGLILDELGAGVHVMAEKGLLWVVARMSCEVLRAPGCEENVRVVVWLGPARLGMYPWQYRIEDISGGVLVRASAVWVISDAETRSMLSKKVPRLSYDPPEPPAEPVEKPAPLVLPPLSKREERAVRYSETDMNGHLTNTRYLDWACDLVDAAYHGAHPVRFLRVDYRAESRLGESVTLDYEQRDNVLWCRGEGKFDAQLRFE